MNACINIYVLQVNIYVRRVAIKIRRLFVIFGSPIVIVALMFLERPIKDVLL